MRKRSPRWILRFISCIVLSWSFHFEIQAGDRDNASARAIPWIQTNSNSRVTVDSQKDSLTFNANSVPVTMRVFEYQRPKSVIIYSWIEKAYWQQVEYNDHTWQFFIFLNEFSGDKILVKIYDSEGHAVYEEEQPIYTVQNLPPFRIFEVTSNDGEVEKLEGEAGGSRRMIKKKFEWVLDDLTFLNDLNILVDSNGSGEARQRTASVSSWQMTFPGGKITTGKDHPLKATIE